MKSIQLATRLALLLLIGGELLMVQWASLASRGSGLTVSEGVVFAGLVGVLNLVAFSLARPRIRAQGLALVLARGWILGSVAALFTGLGLALAWVMLGVLVVVARSGVEVSPEQIRVGLVVTGGLALLMGFGASLWGFTWGQRRVRIDRVDLPVTGLPVALSDLNLVQISDLHIGPLLPPEELRGMVDRVNALGADLVLITGDVFDFDPAYVEAGCRELGRLSATHGVFAVLGNHDVYTGAEQVVASLRANSAIRVLRDEWERLDVGGESLCIAGLEDRGVGWTERDSESTELERLAQEIPESLPTVLLVHRPAFFAQAAALGFDVALTGHTHGGQLSLPGLKHHNPSRLVSRWTRGRFEQGGCVLYVNRGLGVAGLPLRFNCPREISWIRLVPREGSEALP
ncbi:metallophosphoesterase [Myxococcota bacterium]|nr:metallophosphoesterase [Myxococcota bacterium]